MQPWPCSWPVVGWSSRTTMVGGPVRARRWAGSGACLGLNTDSLPTDIQELKASKPSIRWQLPLAPVFRPTPHMRRGKLELLPRQDHYTSLFPPRGILSPCCIVVPFEMVSCLEVRAVRLCLQVSIPLWPRVHKSSEAQVSYLPDEITLVPIAHGCFRWFLR